MNDKELLRELERLKVETGSLACLGCGHEHNCGVHGCAILRAARERIVNAPVADVAPVVHGAWQVTDRFKACSVCGYAFARLLPDNYCPNCGAKMGGEAT